MKEAYSYAAEDYITGYEEYIQPIGITGMLIGSVGYWNSFYNLIVQTTWQSFLTTVISIILVIVSYGMLRIVAIAKEVQERDKAQDDS
jgi:amino acid permease